MPSSLSTWSRALLTVLVLLCVVAVVIDALAVAMIVADERSHTDDWDGLGTFIGLVVGGFATLLLTLLLVLVAMTRSGRRHAARGRLAWAAGLSLALAGVFVLWALSMTTTGSADPSVVLMIALPAVALAVPAAGTLGALRESTAARPRGPWPPTD